MALPLFTIIIPTQNRAGLLAEAIHCATSQTYSNLEVLVMDNASVDDTRDVVARHEGVRIISNKYDIGPTANFFAGVANARGEYFSFLQDDDLIAPQFIERAVSVMMSEKANAYACFCVESESRTALYHSRILGPPLPMNFINGAPRRIQGWPLVCLSLFFSVAIPPTCAFKTAAFIEGTKMFMPRVRHTLLGERMFLAAGAWNGAVALDPVLGGLFYRHDYQLSVRNREPSVFLGDWLSWVDSLQLFWKALPPNWEVEFRGLLNEVPESYRRMWLETNTWWPEGRTPTVALQVRGILEETVCPAKPASRSKDMLHAITPPVLWQFGRALLRRGGYMI